MKNGITAALLLSGLAAAAAAQADEESGFYAGAGVGVFDVRIDDFDDIDETIDDYDSDDTAWKVFGGWRMTKYFAAEVAYVNLGSPDDEILPDLTLTTETDGFAPYLVGTLPIGDWFELFAKAGYYWYETEVQIDTPIGSASESESDSTFTWTAGMGINFFEHINVRLEYEQFDIDQVDDAEALWLTGAWRF